MEKQTRKTTESDLIKAREEGLKSVRSNESMKGHGKIHGMDVFSWNAPNFDNLATVIASFPFPVIWLAKHEQVRCALTYFPEISDRIESVIIYDKPNIKFRTDLYHKVPNLVGLGSVHEAIEMVPAIMGSRNVLLFTTDEPSNCPSLELFREFCKG